MNYDIEKELDLIERTVIFSYEPFIQIDSFKINSLKTASTAHANNLIDKRLYKSIINFIFYKRFNKNFLFNNFYNNRHIIINGYTIIFRSEFYMIVTGENINVHIYNSTINRIND